MLESSPFNLSGGQKRRVAIAGILALEPKYLILDEPAAGLDPYGRNLILDELYKIYKERKITIILVSHSMEDIAKYADRIIVMNKGEAVMDGKPSQIFCREDELYSMGLDIPEISKIMNKLRNMGYDIPKDVFDIKKLADILTGEKNA